MLLEFWRQGQSTFMDMGNANVRCLDTTPDFTGITPYVHHNSVSISPNPNSGRFQLRFEHQPGGSYGVTIYNLTGQIVYEDLFPSGPQMELDLSFLPDGMYWLQLRHPEAVSQQQFIVIHR